MTPAPARRTLAHSLLGSAVVVYLLGFGVAALGGGLALLARPESTAAGPSFAAATVLASIGTSMTAIALAGPLVAAYVARVRLERSGARAGLAQLGVGELDLARAVLPVLVGLGLLGAALVWWAEPPAWTAVHGLKGSPAATAAFLGRLNAGETLTTRGGELVLVEADDEVQIWSRAGWTASAARLGPSGPGWSIEDLEVRDANSRWGAEVVRLRPVTAAQHPTSPLTRGLAELLPSASDRDRLVLHRRLSLPVLGLFLGLIAWFAGRGPAGLWSGLRLSGLVLTTVVALRSSDLAVAAGALPGGIAGWLPTALAGGAVLLLFKAQR